MNKMALHNHVSIQRSLLSETWAGENAGSSHAAAVSARDGVDV